MNITTIKIISAGALVIALGGGLFYYHTQREENEPTVCTMEGKICPDGSTVGRTAPKCEFAACPGEESAIAPAGQGTLKGQMTIGPVCPVETADNPCKPTLEMYAAAKVFVYKTDKKTLVKTITSGAQGSFSAHLPAGDYFIDMIHQRIGGTSGVPTTVSIIAGKSVTLNLSVDTGLR